MLRTRTYLATLLLLSVGAFAQQPAKELSSGALQSCLLGTPEKVWTDLKLTRDQLKRIKYVQEACKEECEGAGVAFVPNDLSNSSGTVVLGEVRNILTKDQYRAWVGYCAAFAPPTK